MTDLSKLTPRELDAVFATEVAGWKLDAEGGIWRLPHHGWEPDDEHPEFSTSMDALLPWLEELRMAGIEICDDAEGWSCRIGKVFWQSQTLPRCIAESLILWKRSQQS